MTRPHIKAQTLALAAIVAAFTFTGSMILSAVAYDIIPEQGTLDAARLWVGAAFVATVLWGAFADSRNRPNAYNQKRGGIRFVRLGRWQFTVSRSKA